MANPTPAQAWQNLKEGNERFVSSNPIHPSQSIETRERLTAGQNPHVVLFGCSDSRVAAEIIFDQGLGDMFVVRTAGHIIDSSVLGSLEFATEVLSTPLIVILGHDSCGAVGAAVQALDSLQMPEGYLRDVVERVAPSVLAGRQAGLAQVDEFVAKHVKETAQLLVQRSSKIAERVKNNEVAIVCLTYTLADGRIVLQDAIGDIGEDATAGV
ncbi:carbonic anhydrase [Jongsikchunia kroppenstedtii]|uniref:carbonic anhydrase n=1 Tax=Jongsikchunia kroppenstedtii TaxID=1121721 RepID=UPI00036A3F13|nr:carbonic anhydrase [Jongsikchunia kroppenstedtii]